ncbi:hypothetical protein PQX77_013670 [Marasmius sp. AFHP31]|nr:hypothetical protein PQX77_013670 [Marasmius sp. AFHP31]
MLITREEMEHLMGNNIRITNDESIISDLKIQEEKRTAQYQLLHLETTSERETDSEHEAAEESSPRSYSPDPYYSPALLGFVTFPYGPEPPAPPVLKTRPLPYPPEVPSSSSTSVNTISSIAFSADGTTTIQLPPPPPSPLPHSQIHTSPNRMLAPLASRIPPVLAIPHPSSVVVEVL